MTSAAASPALPKSKSSGLPTKPNHVTAPITSDENRSSAHQQAENALNAEAHNPNFTHPDHVIPRPDYSRFEDLIIVCCHAIYTPDANAPDFPLYSPHDERNWALAPFQKSNPQTNKPGEHTTFLAHATAGLHGLTIAPSNNSLEKNLLVFSGGPTKKSITALSEARSYYHALLASELHSGNLGGGQTHALFAAGRILLEEHATDSLQNLLFSIILFRQKVGKYPRHIRVVTHAFKARRFLELHAPAIKWPKERIQVQGIDPIMGREELEGALEGEARWGFGLWEKDSLGTGERVKGKRRERGWDEGVVEELTEGLEVEVRGLVSGQVLRGLPWEEEDVVQR